MKKVFKILYIIGFMSLWSSQTFAQSKWHKSISIGLNHGLTAKFDPYLAINAQSSEPIGKGIRLNFEAKIRRAISDGFSIGTGVSLNTIQGLNKETIQTMPFYLTVRYDLSSNENSPFITADFGYSIRLFKPLSEGINASIGVGYVFKKKYMVELLNIHQTVESVTYTPKREGLSNELGLAKFNNIALKFGFVF